MLHSPCKTPVHLCAQQGAPRLPNYLTASAHSDANLPFHLQHKLRARALPQVATEAQAGLVPGPSGLLSLSFQKLNIVLGFRRG